MCGVFAFYTIVIETTPGLWYSLYGQGNRKVNFARNEKAYNLRKKYLAVYI